MHEALPIIMGVSLLALLFTGYPVPFILGGIGLLFLNLSGTPPIFLQNIAARMLGSAQDWLLLSIPIFIFMGIMLDKSGIAKNLLYSLDKVLGKMRGGLALAVILLGTIMAASTGIIGASVVMLGLIALPIMLKEGYNKCLAPGVVAASGTLGILIPPSIMLVMFGSLLQIPVGDLFTGALIPSGILVTFYLIFIFIAAKVKPEFVPLTTTLHDDNEAGVSAASAVLTLLKDLVPPLGLILCVLGSIIIGIATPTEAASVGAFGVIVLTFINGKLTLTNIKDTVLETTKVTGMVMFVAMFAPAFSTVFREIGGTDAIKGIILGLNVGPHCILALLMLIIFLLGFFMEWLEISYILLPLFAGIITHLDFGLGLSTTQKLVWFALLTSVNLQTSFLTPPFGMSLFYIRGVSPPDVTMGHIYKGIIPFVALQLLVLIIIFFFPHLVL